MASSDQHDHLVSYRQALAWLVGALGMIVFVAFWAGISHVRITELNAEMAMVKSQMEYSQRQQQSMENKLVLIGNDMAWNVETTRLIAQKLDVSFPVTHGEK
jgi:hypothetical protein